MAESCIYKITNPKGKIYIGQTSNFKRRMTEHKYMSKKSNLKLYNSISKYGFENHSKEILFLSNDEYEKDMMEIFFISYFDSFKNGLNSTKIPSIVNGFLGKKHTKENVILIKKRMNGVTPHYAIEKRKLKVFCETNNIIFNSISECAAYFNVSHPYISNMLRGKYHNKYNIKLV